MTLIQMKTLAIDPGSNKCGLAWFNAEEQLTKLETLTTDADTPLTRRLSIGFQLMARVREVHYIISEEPFLLGQNNNGMQRLLGIIEYVGWGFKLLPKFIHPMTVKKAMGKGSLDKLEVALAAGELLQTEAEKDLLADAIAREAWDETDAVAIGLTGLGRGVKAQ